jgi:hypothetical protein
MLAGANRSIVANFFTPSYRILGRAFVGASGLVGALNDPNTSHIEVSEASMARLHEPKTIADKNDEIRLVKRGLVVIALGRETDAGSQVAARTGFGRVSRYPVRIVTGTFEMEGELEWAGRFELSALLADGGDFIPLYSATLRAIHYPDLNMKTPALLFNRRKLDIVRMINRDGE